MNKGVARLRTILSPYFCLGSLLNINFIIINNE